MPLSSLPSPLPNTQAVREAVGEAEWAARVELAAAYRLAARFGWTDHIFTHFSARIPGEAPHFLINAFGLTFPEVNASNLLRIDIEGEVLYDPTGRGHNQAGYVIHGAIHQARHDLTCVLHTHTTTGAAVSAQRQGLRMISQHAARFHGEVGYHDYEGFALDRDEQQRLVQNLGDKRVMILRNHGLLAAGRSVGEAFQGLYFLERSCAIQIAAQAGGAELVTPSDAVLQKTAQVYASGTGGRYTERIWDAFLRELDREDPDYRL